MNAKRSYGCIAQTFERVAPSTLVLAFSNGEKIETTAEHPFYVEHKGFTPAGLVAIGNSIVTRAGPALQVTRVEKHESAHRVYNFEVADYHTYFVGDSALWVHNANYPSLKFLHPNPATQNPTSYAYWSNKSTQEIMDSLKLGTNDELVAKLDGSIMNGNTRAYILRERGVDIDSLPRRPHFSDDDLKGLFPLD